MINYADQHHVYFNDKKVIYDSPTKILKKYKERFDAKTASKAYAKKFGKTPEYWQAEWRKKGKTAIIRGNKIHASREEGSFGRAFEKISGAIRPVVNGHLYNPVNLGELPDGSYPELPIWNDGWMVAGRPDKFVIETIDGIRYIDVYDYKSNFIISKISYQDRNGEYKRMLAPVNHLMDSKWVEYSLQLSFYTYILETWGFTPRVRELIHVQHPLDAMGVEIPQSDIHYPLPYLKAEILDILNHYSRRRRIALYEPETSHIKNNI